MPKIIVSNLFKKAISFTSNNETPESVLMILHKNNIDWMFACGGKGKCTTCKFEVINGPEHLSALSDPEEHFMLTDKLRVNQRLACQAIPTGDIEIKVLDDNKLPHLIYSI